MQFPYQKMHFPAEKCTFLQKNAVFRGHVAGNRRKLQEGFRAQESRTLANFHKNLRCVWVGIASQVGMQAARGTVLCPSQNRLASQSHGDAVLHAGAQAGNMQESVMVCTPSHSCLHCFCGTLAASLPPGTKPIHK